jgi:uncharacterized protein VirK/YbjX
MADVPVRSLRFMAQSLNHLSLALDWYDDLDREPLASVVAVDHSLYRRLQQPYLCADRSREQVLASVRSHYRLFQANLSPACFAAIYVRNQLELATWTAERRYIIYLRQQGALKELGASAINEAKASRAGTRAAMAMRLHTGRRLKNHSYRDHKHR